MSILAFQPDAERYYAEGYWRAGDLWADFAARASTDPAKTAIHAEDSSITYEGLERAAVALSARLAAAGIAAGRRRAPAGPQLGRGRRRPARVFSLRRRRGPAAADVRGARSWQRWPSRRTRRR